MDVSVRVTGAKETIAALKQMDEGAVKKLRQEIKGVMQTEISTIVSGIPAFAPIRGMAHNGRTKWKRPKGNVSFTPGSVRGFGGKGFSPLVTLTFTGGTNSVGFDMAELAGIRRNPPRGRSKIAGSTANGTQRGDGSHANNGQGDAFISKLEEVRPIKGRAGRFAFDLFLRRKPIIQRKAIDFVDKYFTTTIKRAA